MTNAELIKALRYCGNFADRDGCDEECPYFNDKDCPKRIMCDAADALEAADKRIAELEAQLKDGEWIEVHDWIQIPQEERGTYRCSACGQVMKYPWNYCPNCGAMMRKGEHDGES